MPGGDLHPSTWQPGVSPKRARTPARRKQAQDKVARRFWSVLSVCTIAASTRSIRCRISSGVSEPCAASRVFVQVHCKSGRSASCLSIRLARVVRLRVQRLSCALKLAQRVSRSCKVSSNTRLHELRRLSQLCADSASQRRQIAPDCAGCDRLGFRLYLLQAGLDRIRLREHIREWDRRRHWNRRRRRPRGNRSGSFRRSLGWSPVPRHNQPQTNKDEKNEAFHIGVRPFRAHCAAAGSKPNCAARFLRKG